MKVGVHVRITVERDDYRHYEHSNAFAVREYDEGTLILAAREASSEAFREATEPLVPKEPKDA